MKTKVCECCGSHFGLEKAIGHVQCGPVSRRMVEHLARQNGRFVATSALADVVYADDRDGGPEDAVNVMRILALRMRPRLAKAGIDLQSHIGSGYALRWAQ